MVGGAQYGLLTISALLLLGAHYRATWRRHGARWSRASVWVSTAIAVLFWWYRL